MTGTTHWSRFIQQPNKSDKFGARTIVSFLKNRLTTQVLVQHFHGCLKPNRSNSFFISLSWSNTNSTLPNDFWLQSRHRLLLRRTLRQCRYEMIPFHQSEVHQFRKQGAAYMLLIARLQTLDFCARETAAGTATAVCVTFTLTLAGTASRCPDHATGLRMNK